MIKYVWPICDNFNNFSHIIIMPCCAWSWYAGSWYAESWYADLNLIGQRYSTDWASDIVLYHLHNRLMVKKIEIILLWNMHYID
jgi:hypothetical protein